MAKDENSFKSLIMLDKEASLLTQEERLLIQIFRLNDCLKREIYVDSAIELSKIEEKIGLIAEVINMILNQKSLKKNEIVMSMILNNKYLKELFWENLRENKMFFNSIMSHESILECLLEDESFKKEFITKEFLISMGNDYIIFFETLSLDRMYLIAYYSIHGLNKNKKKDLFIAINRLYAGYLNIKEQKEIGELYSLTKRENIEFLLKQCVVKKRFWTNMKILLVSYFSNDYELAFSFAKKYVDRKIFIELINIANSNLKIDDIKRKVLLLSRIDKIDEINTLNDLEEYSIERLNSYYKLYKYPRELLIIHQDGTYEELEVKDFNGYGANIYASYNIARLPLYYAIHQVIAIYDEIIFVIDNTLVVAYFPNKITDVAKKKIMDLLSQIRDYQINLSGGVIIPDSNYSINPFNNGNSLSIEELLKNMENIRLSRKL